MDIGKIKAAHGKSRGRYGARKVWHQLRRDGHDIARRTVERLMRLHGLQGVVRGQKKTTIPDPAQSCPDDKVNRQFVAAMPNQLRVSDFTHVSTWAGMVHVAIRRENGPPDRFLILLTHRCLRPHDRGLARFDLDDHQIVPDALNQAICQRCLAEGCGLLHHSDRASQYLSIRHTERLADAGIDTSVGSVGDSYDDALAESIIGLFKTEVIKFLGPWKSVGQVEWETLQWVSWYDNERLHDSAEEAVDQRAAVALTARVRPVEAMKNGPSRSIM
ncbi:MAG: IS3 family transposase [Defluviimonas sp.]|nr:IS3 family transposase [Defluviimonas sp.]